MLKFKKKDTINPIYSWCPNIEQGATNQIINLASLPFLHKHIAIMPDCHQGYGMPIGAVIATKGVVIPNSVGVDIGCGMCAIKTSLTTKDLDKPTLIKIIEKIKKTIPVGFNKHKKSQGEEKMPAKMTNFDITNNNKYIGDLVPIVQQQFDPAKKSLGTLGGGNHFIEIQKDEKENIWIMLHSGSRNLGLKVATHYNKIAQELNAKYHSSIPKEWELAFLPLDSKEGKGYINEMNYCINYAFANRKLMIKRILQIFAICGPLTYKPIINIAHNYATMENHYGENVMVHRKGATLAKKGEIGIIPGSQGSSSYIVEGLGNPKSFNSCSHGAGRTIGRKDAIRKLNLKKEQKILNDQGIIHNIDNKNKLDEATSCYKNIDEVMENQKDLVKIITKLTPLAVIKA